MKDYAVIYSSLNPNEPSFYQSFVIHFSEAGLPNLRIFQYINIYTHVSSLGAYNMLSQSAPLKFQCPHATFTSFPHYTHTATNISYTLIKEAQCFAYNRCLKGLGMEQMAGGKVQRAEAS